MDWTKIRSDFPVLKEKMHGHSLVYLDSAATSQKPYAVIQRLQKFYESENANVHRGAYLLSAQSTDAYEKVRSKVCQFIGTMDEREIIFTSGTTEAINLIAQTLGITLTKAGDTVIVTRMEHHANFVPWQNLCSKTGAQFKITELTSDFRIDLNHFKSLLKLKPKIVAFTMMSNVLGTETPVAEMAALAKEVGAIVVVDGAQAVAHRQIQISKLGPIDFFTFSSHKICGPTGAGVLWGRYELLKTLPPYQFGGDMILKVSDSETLYQDPPQRFEAGTPNIAGVIGMGEAIDYLKRIGMDVIGDYEDQLTDVFLNTFQSHQKELGLTLLGPQTSDHRGSIFTFTLDHVHPHDLATFLDYEGLAVRAGHHCAQPLLSKLAVQATARASLSFINTTNDIQKLFEALKRARNYFLKKGGKT